MLEKLIDDWLTRANERSYQAPFCHILQSLGHTIIHSSRHSPIEYGKDVISLDQAGRSCAFQLKSTSSPRLSLTQWRNECKTQADELVTTAIEHPSIPSSAPHHRSFFVVNADLEEEVHGAISKMNAAWAKATPQYKLESMVLDQIAKPARDLGDKFWPSNLRNVRDLLELYFEESPGLFPKEKLARILEEILVDSLNTNSGATECSRALASGGIFTAIALSAYSKSDNFWAEAEAWTVYAAYALAVAERFDLSEGVWKSSLDIATGAIIDSLEDLHEDIVAAEHLVVGDGFADGHFIPGRRTHLAGAMGALWLLRRQQEWPRSELDVQIGDFLRDAQDELQLWGEAAVPLYLAAFWALSWIQPTAQIEQLPGALANAIARANHPHRDKGIPNPYYGYEEVLIDSFGLSDEPIRDDFVSRAFSVEALLYLFVRRNWKQRMKRVWPHLTHVGWVHYEAPAPWHLLRWRVREGTEVVRFAQRQGSWTNLQKEAAKRDFTSLPRRLVSMPALAALFLVVFPHRLNPAFARAIDSGLDDMLDS